MDKNSNSLNWFEIPAENLDRAKTFYEKTFDCKFEVLPDMMGMKMASFPSEMGGKTVSGALVQSQMHKPSQTGSMLYLNANPSIDNVIGRIEKAGGKVVMPKTQISPEIGYMAFFVDTEGNKIGLHAQK
jgi:predicted enzyme related to lactoylglutathione lyase